MLNAHSMPTIAMHTINGYYKGEMVEIFKDGRRKMPRICVVFSVRMHFIAYGILYLGKHIYIYIF